MLEHAESKVLLVDPEFVNLAREALSLIPNQHIVVIDVADTEYEGENQFWVPLNMKNGSLKATLTSLGIYQKMNGMRLA